MLQVTPLGVLSLVAVLACWIFAAVLFRAGTPGSIARKLSLLLVFEGITLATSGAGIGLWLPGTDQPSQQLLWLYPIILGLHTLGDCGMLALYPPFLAASLRTPLTHPFATRRARLVLLGLAAALFLAVNLAENPVTLTLLYLSLVMVFGFALVAAIHAWKIASGMARTRAKIFMLAFGFRDICWGFVYLTAFTAEWWTEYNWEGLFGTVHATAYIFGTLVAVPLIAYGILRTQLFDIDLKIRWTLKQSTVAGMVVAIIFVVSEGAAQFLSAELGNITGLLAAAVVMFFLAPLQRFADRVATAAMPNTQNTPEYQAFRKMQVYEAAVSEALLEGGISDKERSLLGRLRESLGVSEGDASAIETELRSAVGSG